MELGATADEQGVRFAVYSAAATGVDVCLVEPDGTERRVPLPDRTDNVWSGRVDGIGPGQRYGFRARGPWNPGHGDLFNPAKLLLDPYGRAIAGTLRDDPALRADSDADSAPYVPRSVVVAPLAPAVRPALRPWSDTVLYELHVKGFTAAMPDVPPALRGTYAGLGHPAAVGYLRRLGVTAVELLPVQHSVTEPSVAARGLTNYWGYNTLGYFAPDTRFASQDAAAGRPADALVSAEAAGKAVAEFRAMVDALHAAGIEVILDVVYNHTAEGSPDGPTLSFRGLDNRTYYRLDPGDGTRYRDYTGCGNTLDLRQPPVLRLVLDSLRYWATTMGVDGFRFDLASALTRSTDNVDRYSAFLGAVGQDPVLRGVRLIAEPWDLGMDGYRVGGFPPPWAEWNGRYRDAVRDFWRGSLGNLAEVGTRLAGSEDLYGLSGRGPYASVNFVTAHDGFTLRDLVSHERKHNAANGEHGADGTDDNRSENFGVEGDTNDPAILAVRARQVRNLLATLLLSAGTPMLLAGDEIGHTQHGNNNAYCQDNETSWLGWPAADGELLAFVRELLALRAAEPVFRRRRFFTGATVDGRRDLVWYRPDGAEITAADWYRPGERTLGAWLDGARADTGTGASFLLYLHSGRSAVDVVLPAAAEAYTTVVDTAGAAAGTHLAGATVRVPPLSVLLLRAA